MNFTRRELMQGIAGAAIAAGVLGVRPAMAWSLDDLKGSGEVVVFDGGGAFGEALRAAYFKPFEEATGIKVVPAANMPPGAVRTSILAGAPAYDVMIFSGGQVNSLIEDGMLEKLDFSIFPQEELDQFTARQPNDYMIPALFYAITQAYSTEAFGDKPPQTWTDMWNTTDFPGKRTLHNAGEDVLAGCVFEIAMLADGAAPDQVYPIDFDRVFKSLDRLKPEILRFWSAGAEPGQMLLDGSVNVAAAWNGRVSALVDEGAPVSQSWNQAVIQWDAWTVLKGAKNRDNAMKFMAFLTRAEAQAKFAELIEYGPTNAGAFALIPPERAAKLPGNADMIGSQVVQDYDWWSAKDATGKTNVQLATEAWQKWITG